MNNEIKVVSNSRPLYLAEPVFGDRDNVVELCFTQIVAWKVQYHTNDEGGEFSFATPVTVDSGLPSRYGIYDVESKHWTIPDSTTGQGEDTLLNYFKNKEI